MMQQQPQRTVLRSAPAALTALLVAALAAAPALAQEGNGQNNGQQPAAQQGENEQQAEQREGQPLPVTIVAVQNLVQVRGGENADWQPAKKGMQLGLGAEFRTGPRSAVRFTVGDSQVVTLDRLGVIKVVNAIKQNGKIQTDLGMEYGRSELEVQAGGVEHESQIRSPGATLAVRGTKAGQGYNAGYPVKAFCTSHASSLKAYGAAYFRQLEAQGLMEEGDRNPADRRYAQGTFNPTEDGNTDDENERWATWPAGIHRQKDQDFRELKQLEATQRQFTKHGNPTEDLVFGQITTTMSTFPVRAFDGAVEDGDVVRGTLDNDLLTTGTDLSQDPAQQVTLNAGRTVTLDDGDMVTTQNLGDLVLTNEGFVYQLNLEQGTNRFSLEDVMTPEGNGQTLTGEVEAPHNSGQTFDFFMDQVGDRRSLVIEFTPNTIDGG